MVSAKMETYLEHNVLKWSIRNYYGFEHSDSEILCSPTFHLGKSSTNWLLSISFKEKTLWIHLSRCLKDLGFKSVRVNYKFSLANNNNQMVTYSNRENSFLKSDIQSLNVPDLDIHHLLNNQNFANDDDLTILCEIYIFLHRFRPRQTKSREFLNLQKFSSFLQSMYEKCEHCDVTLNTSEGYLKANKSILIARSAFFRSKLKTEFEIKFPDTPIKALDKIILYIYTGNFELYVRDRSYIFAIAELAKKLKLSYLNALFAAEEIHFLTEIEVEAHKFTWLLRNFNINGQNSTFISPCFPTANRVWFLSLYPVESKESKTKLKVGLNAIGFEGQIQVLVQISIKEMDEDNNFIESEPSPRIFQILDEEGSIDFPPSDTRKLYKNCIKNLEPNNNTLAICASWIICPENEVTSNSKLIQRTTLSALGDCKLNSLRNMAADFYQRLITHYSSDLLKTIETVLKTLKESLFAHSDVPKPVISTNELCSDSNCFLDPTPANPDFLKYIQDLL